MWVDLDPAMVSTKGLEYVRERLMHYQAIADDPRAESYRKAVVVDEGVLECDPGAVVSISDDEAPGSELGAYVMTWYWVAREEIED